MSQGCHKCYREVGVVELGLNRIQTQHYRLDWTEWNFVVVCLLFKNS